MTVAMAIISILVFGTNSVVESRTCMGGKCSQTHWTGRAWPRNLCSQGVPRNDFAENQICSLDLFSYLYASKFDAIWNFVGSAKNESALAEPGGTFQPKASGGASTSTVTGFIRIGVGIPSPASTVAYKCKTRKGALPGTGANPSFLHFTHM